MSKSYVSVGRRKSAIAQVKIELNKISKFCINNKDKEIFDKLKNVLTITDKSFQISVIAKGGGIASQKDAIVLGVARCLVKYDENLKPSLRKNGYLTRDKREKERKKPGLKGARRAPQWAKR